MIALLALRERVKRWVKREAVRFGVVCIHEVDPKAWRPAAKYEWEITSEPGYDVARPGRPNPARVCRYCERVEALTEGDFYARFGRAWNEGRA